MAHFPDSNRKRWAEGSLDGRHAVAKFAESRTRPGVSAVVRRTKIEAAGGDRVTSTLAA